MLINPGLWTEELYSQSNRCGVYVGVRLAFENPLPIERAVLHTGDWRDLVSPENSVSVFRAFRFVLRAVICESVEIIIGDSLGCARLTCHNDADLHPARAYRC
ncbi:Hypothetical protein SMAX5B_018274 [Scophthalmus maximus]|uniref:Uncharacterized protein n=1 Tax=Scophthalmus maximus TaxID=52904 RepID=A0A2U9CE85_SCOMX|nr:Hypothetical protein SMAX5B_018274 [Scophthalmus maximus]KAF0026374.1 hypothetical protein F2P81_021111 [Scophthalmus maximus]